MSTIIVSPLRSQDEPTFEVIQLQVVVNNSDWVGFFDQFEVWRSQQTEAGPYEELTAATWSPARMPKGAGDPPSPSVTGQQVNIVGMDLQLKVDEKEDLVVVFTGADPLTFADCAAQIATQSAGKLTSYVDSRGTLVIETADSGTGATLRVVGGEAAPQLNLPTEEPESLVYGHDARVPLVLDQESYLFADLAGSANYYYRTRFRNRLSGAVSEFSLSFSATQEIGVQESSLVTGQLDLISLDGKPLEFQEVRVHSNFNGTIVDEKVVAGTDVVKNTDANGRVQFVLVRGQKVTVAITGTDLVRDITVPTDSSITIFNLLDPTISGEDIFKVRVPNIIYAERRSL